MWIDQPGGTGQMLAALADGSLDVVSILTEGAVWPSFVIAATDAALTARTTEVGRVVDAVVASARALHAPRQGWNPDLGTEVLAVLREGGFRPGGA